VLAALGRGAEALEALREMRIKAPGNAKVCVPATGRGG
jgi:hypothetical protein